ncbi:vWA domain-containing protein [Jiangella muralis]|uniref:vWA domain-containing protein n=1 Tax=Jiangella muralis TaxID=702383 RepID=UPI00069FA704|nr:VWA domain-containing protein [Jiangella muralis]
MIRLAAALTAAAAVVATMSVSAVAAAEEPVDPGSRMMLVLDSSGSMAEATPSGGTRIDAAKDALRQVIGGLPDDQEVGLRVYGAEVFSQNDPGACTDSQLIAKPDTGNRDALTAALDGYEPYGETPIGYALQEAGKDLGTEGPRTIVLVSDGEPTCAPDPCEVATQLAGDGVDVRIDVVGLDVDTEARDKLRCIADNGHGTYYDAQDADDLVRSLDTSTTRASRPFDLTGTPIQGTATPADAPIIETGQYLDTVPLNDGLWYRIERTAPNSTIHVGVAHHSDDIGNSGSWAWVRLYADPDELECASASSFPLGNLGYTAANTWSPDPEGECNTADVIYVHVDDSGPQPFTGEPVEIAVYEEPPLADPSGRDLVAAPEVPAWTPLEVSDPVTDVVPGTSISNAPVVSDGTYAFDIHAGETQVVAVPLDWGQNVQAQLDGIVPEETSLGVGPTVQISGPVREQGSVDFYGSAPDDWTDLLWGTIAGGSPFRVGAQSLTIGYLNRTEISNDASIPGLRYVQVSYPNGSDPMRYTLTLKTNGTAGDGAPEYADVDGLTPPAADSALVGGSGDGDAEDDGATDDATPGGDPTEEQALTSDGGGGADLPWTSIGLGAAGVLALAGAGWLVRRNRATAKQAGSN